MPPNLGRTLFIFGAYQVFELFEADGDGFRYAVVGPQPFPCSTFGSLADAIEAARSLSSLSRISVPPSLTTG